MVGFSCDRNCMQGGVGLAPHDVIREVAAAAHHHTRFVVEADLAVADRRRRPAPAPHAALSTLAVPVLIVV
jgi:hypothetical protein